MIKVTKEFTFDMAHALLNYDGPCKNIHGHTYHLHITVVGYPNQDPQHPKCGMVIDFSQLKKIVKAEVIEKFDHALVLNEAMSSSLQTQCTAISEQIYFVPFQPTCENLLLHIKSILQEALNTHDLTLQTVRLYETPTSWAEWSYVS